MDYPTWQWKDTSSESLQNDGRVAGMPTSSWAEIEPHSQRADEVVEILASGRI